MSVKLNYLKVLEEIPKLNLYKDKENDFQLSYRFRKIGDEIPILFLHGFNGNSKSWAYQFLYFRNKRSVIAIDFPGFGKSDTTDLDMFEIAKLIVNLLNKLGIKKLDIVGHSMGGMLSQIIAAEFSSIVNKLVLSCTHKGFAFLTGKPLMEPYRLRLEERKKMSDKEFGKLRITKMLPELNNEEVFNFLSYISGEISEGSIKSGGMAMQTLDTTNYLVKVFQQCLILKAARDVIVSNKQSRSLEKSLPHATVLELSDVGHAPYCENSSEFNEAIETFFNS